MKLYYTTSQGSEQVQDKPSLSIGGYKSSSPVPNGKLGNLFSDISQLTISNYRQNQYIGLILKNELSGTVNNAKLWFDFLTDSYSKFRVAFVSLSADSEGQLYMERLTDKYSKPISIQEFFEANSESNKVNIANFLSGAQVGVWIERELLLDVIKTDQSLVYELQEGYTDRYKERVLGKEDNIKLNISWD